jgi:hypothetical protein
MNGVPAEGPFQRLVAALEPWLDRMVIVGGWAHQLYRLHPSAQPLDYPPLTTLDADIAVPAKLPAGERDIRERLLAHGFTEELFGDDRPPAMHYLLRGEVSGFYVEFLTPLIGSDNDRKHKRKATMEISGIVSQQLRHIEILLSHPWSIDLKTAIVQVANPVAFLAQKILIHGRRERRDRAKDILYIHDTVEIFGARLVELAAMWRDDIAGQLHRRNSSAVSKASEVLFGELSDDTRRAAAISVERALSPEAIRQACRYGLAEVFVRVR